MDGQIYFQIDRLDQIRLDRQIDIQIDSHIDRQIAIQLDRQIDVQIDRQEGSSNNSDIYSKIRKEQKHETIMKKTHICRQRD